MERLYHAMFLAGMFALLILAACMAYGCKANPGAGDPKQQDTGNKIAAAQAHVETAQYHVDRVIPHTIGEDHADLNAAAQSLTIGAGDLAAAQKLLAEATAACAAKDAELVKARDELKAERSHWVGYRTRVWAAWIVGIGVLAWIGAGIAGVLIRGALGATILNVIPFSNFFLFMRAKRLAAPVG